MRGVWTVGKPGLRQGSDGSTAEVERFRVEIMCGLWAGLRNLLKSLSHPGVLNAFKVIGVEFFDRVGFVIGNADAMVDHVFGKRVAIDEHDSEVSFCRGVDGAGCKSCAGDEYSLGSSVFAERSDEFTDSCGTNVGFVTLGLYVHHVEAQAVFLYDTVNSTVAALSDDLRGVKL